VQPEQTGGGAPEVQGDLWGRGGGRWGAASGQVDERDPAHGLAGGEKIEGSLLAGGKEGIIPGAPGLGQQEAVRKVLDSGVLCGFWTQIADFGTRGKHHEQDCD